MDPNLEPKSVSNSSLEQSLSHVDELINLSKQCQARFSQKTHSASRRVVRFKEIIHRPQFTNISHDDEKMASQTVSPEGFSDWKQFLPQIRFASLGNRTLGHVLAGLILVA